MSFRYSTVNEELKILYADLLNSKSELITVKDDHQHELALLMSQISILLNTPSENVTHTQLETWKIILDTIRLKVSIIKELRRHAHTKFREDQELQKAKAYTQEDFFSIVACITKLLFEEFPPDKVINVVARLQETLSDWGIR